MRRRGDCEVRAPDEVSPGVVGPDAYFPAVFILCWRPSLFKAASIRRALTSGLGAPQMQ